MACISVDFSRFLWLAPVFRINLVNKVLVCKGDSVPIGYIKRNIPSGISTRILWEGFDYETPLPVAHLVVKHTRNISYKNRFI